MMSPGAARFPRPGSTRIRHASPGSPSSQGSGPILRTFGGCRVAAWTIAVQAQAEHDPAALRELRRVGEKDVLTRIEIHLPTALVRCELGDQRGTITAIEQSLDLAEQDRIILSFVLTGAWKLLESLPAWETAHAALVTSILDVVHSGTPSTGVPAEELSPSELRVLRYLTTNLTRPEIARSLMLSVP
jgi:LuxR family transcriptional regulator, maltose regulon positive regulatory protein